jgi:NitT/TauT family transport system substrate-binding protein
MSARDKIKAMGDVQGDVVASRREVLKIGVGVTGAALAASLLPGSALAAQDEVSIVLNWVKSVQFGGHFVAIDQGFFAAQDINAEVMSGGPGIDSINLVASKQATLGDRDSTNIILARAKGFPIKAFASVLQKNPYSMMSLKSNPVRSLEDMVGKVVAIPSQRRPTMVALMKKAGIDPSDVTFVPTGTDPGILPTKQVDAYFGWATNQGVMLRMRGVDLHIVSLDELGDYSHPMVFFALDETLKNNRDVVVRWLRAEVEGWKWFAENPEETARITVEKYGQKGLDLDQQLVESRTYPDYIMAGHALTKGPLWVGTDKFEAGMSLALEAGLLKKEIPLSDLVDQSLIEEVHGI